MLKKSFLTTGQVRRIKGALRSNSPAARLGMFLRATGLFSRLLDQVFYRILCNNESKDNNLPPCLMIVSPPRSGSTIVYQVLVRVIPSVYISNFHFLFPNYASSYMLRKNLFGRNLGGVRNYYGYTSSIYDINEGNEIVEAVFSGSATRALVRERFIRFVKVMQATQQRPLIFKNVRAYNCIARLHKAVPEVVFLRIRRNPEQAVQSTVRAYHELGTFHPIPENLLNCKINDPVEFAVQQYLAIEREIYLQKKEMDQSTWFECWYEDFCLDPWHIIEDLAENYLNMKLSCLRRDAMPQLKVSKRVKVSASEARQISLLLPQYTNEK